MQTRAYSVLTAKAVETADARIIEGIASTPTPDRVKDIVEPMGAKFALPMPLLWQHRADEPVGQVDFAAPTKDGIPFRARFAKIDEPGELKNLVDKAWQAVKAGLVRGVSIGFKSLDHDVMKNGGYRIKEWEWLELSLVTIPANAQATIQNIKSYDAKAPAATGTRRPASSTPGDSGSAHKAPTKGTGTMKSITEQISDRKTDLDVLAKRLESLLAKDEAEGIDATEREELGTLETDIKESTDKLRRLNTLEKAMANAATVDGSDTVKASASRGREQIRVYPEVKVKEEPGIGMARWTICMARAHNDHERAFRMAKQLWPNSPAIQMLKTADVPAADTRDAQWASPLVTPAVLASEFIEWLRARTIVGQFGTGGIPSLRRIPFNVRVPSQTSAGTGYWVGEGNAKPVTSWGFTYTEHRWFKLANIAVMTEEIMRFANPSIEVLVRDELANALSDLMDTDFITPSITVSAVRPASITNGANTAASSGPTAADVGSDIATLLAFMTGSNIQLNSLVLVMRQAQAISLSLMKTTLGVFEFPTVTPNGGSLFGIPVIVSNYVPSGVVVLLNANDVFLSDDGGVNVAMSREASLEMETEPAMSANTGASPSAISAQAVVSMFQTNCVAIRVERFINWSRRRDDAVAYLTATGWGNTASSPDGAPL